LFTGQQLFFILFSGTPMVRRGWCNFCCFVFWLLFFGNQAMARKKVLAYAKKLIK
jgi:hypothetical protein